MRRSSDEEGRYTSGQRDADSEAEDVPPAPTSTPLTDVESDNEPDPLSPTTSLAVEVADSCDICGYTEDEGIVGICLGIALPPGDIGWVQCDKYLKWFHHLCLGVEEDLIEDDWICSECSKFSV